MNGMTTLARAELLRDQVIKTWDPPREAGNQSTADVAQTAAMQTLAWLLGRDWLPDLTENQQAAIDTGLALLERELLVRPSGG